MTEITHDEIRDALPDLLHDRLDAGLRQAVEKHLLSCAECRAELAVLRMVEAAPSFEPAVDAAKISAVIPPYAGVDQRAPAVHEAYWQASAMLVAVVLVAGSVVLSRRESARVSPVQNSAQVAASKTNGAPAHQSTGASVGIALAPTGPAVVRESEGSPKPQELQLAAGLDGMSDRGVAQLLRELDKLDPLPSPDPEPLGLSEGETSTEQGGGQ
jgi:Putative zinc-finger